MAKVLRIEDVITTTENKSKIKKYVFNNDKIVRVDAETDEVLTKNVPKTYVDLISLYSAKAEAKDDDEDDDEIDDAELRERAQQIMSGKGAGLGVFLGLLVHFTIIGPIIAWCFSIGFLNDISDEDYLLSASVKDINFRKGFYSTVVYGWIVGIACCSQWKTDMVSVLDGNPNRQSENKHICFKVWFWPINILAFIGGFVNGYNTNTATTTTTNSSSYYLNNY